MLTVPQGAWAILLAGGMLMRRSCRGARFAATRGSPERGPLRSDATV